MHERLITIKLNLAKLELERNMGKELTPNEVLIANAMYAFGTLDTINEYKRLDKLRDKAINAVLMVVLAIGLLVPTTAHAQVDDQQAIQALIGEAIGQSDEELRAHAHAIRNRGNLNGVYGLRSWRKHDSEQAWQRASKAWYTSEYMQDNTNGANHWLSEYDLKRSRAELIAWRYKAKSVVKIGDTYFYKMERIK